MEEKIGKLIKSVSQNQATSHQTWDPRFARLEREVATSQEDVTKRAIKRAKQDCLLEFRKKGHEEQYYLNANVGDRIKVAAKKMKKVTPASEKEAKLLQDTLDKLKEGMYTLVEHQKHTQIADRSKSSWRAVMVYKSNGIGDNKEYNKQINQADKEAQDKMAHKKNLKGQRAKKKATSIPATWVLWTTVVPRQGPPPPLPPPPPMLQPGPPRQLPVGSRQSGPCFQFGHYRA